MDIYRVDTAYLTGDIDSSVSTSIESPYSPYWTYSSITCDISCRLFIRTIYIDSSFAIIRGITNDLNVGW